MEFMVVGYLVHLTNLLYVYFSCMSALINEMVSFFHFFSFFEIFSLKKIDLKATGLWR